MPEHELTPECRSMLRQSAALAGIGAFVVDLDSGRCLYCSEQLARLHGLRGYCGAAPLGGAAHLERIHPDDRERYRAALAAAGDAGRYEVDYRMYAADGALVRLRETGERVDGRSGARLVGCVRPFDEAERIERASAPEQPRGRGFVQPEIHRASLVGRPNRRQHDFEYLGSTHGISTRLMEARRRAANADPHGPGLASR